MNTNEFLPLTEVALEVLLSLSEGNKHGYAIMQEVSDRTDGRLKLHAGTLYRALNRMLENDLIEEHRAEDTSDARRRNYGITEFGRQVARSELARLSRQIEVARSVQLFGGEEPA
jgi:DNA-binding PadR family transcriptional regulator